MKTHLRTIGAAAAAIAALALAGCSGASAPAPQSSAGKDTTLTVGITPISNAAALYLGIKLGYFADQKLDVKPKVIQAAASAIPSLLTNEMQFALVSSVPAITAASKGLKVNVVTGNDRYSDDPSKPDGSVLVAAKGSGIADATGLAGKTIAIVGLKSAPELAVRLALKNAGVDASNVKFVEMAYPDMVPALESDKVDAAVVVDPYLTQAKQAGLKVVMQPFPEGLPGKAGQTWIAASSFLAKDPDAAARFKAAIDKSVAYAAANPDQVRDIMGSYTQISAAARNSAILPQFDSSISTSDLQYFADAMKQESFITTKYDASKLLWSR